MSNSESPYVGPRPFTPGDEKIFYGRDAEAQALMSLIMSHSAVLLYSQSGAGKTSLLNAKVRQLLEARDADFLGSARVGGSLPPGVDPAEISNIFIYFALTSLEGEEPAKKSYDGKTTLPEYLDKVRRRKGSDKEVTDQNLLEKPPVQRVIFFDQFEEIFTTSQQRWENRTGFFEQVGEALQVDPLLRVVFAMREEYLASLNVYVSHLPERLRTRFHLERLRYTPALEAVTRPLDGTNRKFATGVAEQLVQNLLRVPVRSQTGFEEITGEFVEPVQLQVVCQNIWNSLHDDVNEINAEFIESCGDVDVALTNYYEDCLKRLIEKHTIKETRVRRWFDNELITADGLRGIVYQGDKTTGTLPNEVVSMLEDLRLVRAEPRGGALWYELTHDRFIAPIRKSNRSWFSKQQGGLASILETKVIEYRNNPQDENLLSGSELKNALDWLVTAEAEDSEVSGSLRAYILDSKNAAAKRRARTLRRQVAALVLLFLGALFVAGWAYREKGRADRARYDERADVANAMVELKKYDDALVWGLKSVEPALTQSGAPSQHGITTLRSALKAAGRSIWSRTFSYKPRIAVSSDGELICTTDDKEWTIWRGPDGQKIFHQQFDKDNPTGGQQTEQGSAPERSRIVTVSFSPAGKFLIIRRRLLSDDAMAPPRYPYEVWDLRNNLRPIISDAEYLQFANDDSRVLIRDKEKVRIIEVSSNKSIFALEEKSDLTSLSPTGQQLLQIINGAVVFRNFNQDETKTNQMAFPGSSKLYYSAFSDDGKRLVILPDRDIGKTILTFWDTESGKKISEIPITINPRIVNYAFKILSGNTSVLMVEIGPLERSETVAQIWDVTNNTLTKINEKVTRFIADARSWHLIRTDKTARTILRDPRDHNSWVEFTELPENITFVPSKQLNAAVTLTEDNVMQYWKPASFNVEIDKLSPAELYRTACDKLRYQEKEFEQVKNLCRQPDFVNPS